MKRERLPDTVRQALQAADRTPGWNMRPRDVRAFTLDRCVLLVVPFARWRYHRRDRIAAEWRTEQARG